VSDGPGSTPAADSATTQKALTVTAAIIALLGFGATCVLLTAGMVGNVGDVMDRGLFAMSVPAIACFGVGALGLLLLHLDRRRMQYEMAHAEKVRAQIERLGDDTSTELSKVIAIVRERVAAEQRMLTVQQQMLTTQQQMFEDSATRHQAILEEMKRIADESLAMALSADRLAGVVDLGKRIAAGPNGASGRPAS
jgi:hypothetical protein